MTTTHGSNDPNTLKLGLVQMNSATKDRDGNVKKAMTLVDQAVDAGAELVVLPEFYNTEYFAQYWDYSYVSYAEPADGYTITRAREKAAERSIHLVATIYEIEGPGLYYDTMFLIGPDGSIVGKYRKAQPAGMRSVEKLFYRAGNKFPVWPIKNFMVGAVICYDHVFPETIRSVAVNGADLVVGPFATKAIPNWDALMQTRAFENGIYMAPCNKVGQEDNWLFSGESMVVDPTGTILHKASGTEEEVFVVELRKEVLVDARVTYPMLRDRRPHAYRALVETYENVRNLSN